METGINCDFRLVCLKKFQPLHRYSRLTTKINPPPVLILVREAPSKL